MRNTIAHEVTLALNKNITFFDDQANIIMGSNGAGKTTLLEHIGEYCLNTSNIKWKSLPINRRVGFLFQHPQFFPTFTVRETVNLYKELGRNSPLIRQPYMQNLENTLLNPILDHKIGKVSGGELTGIFFYCTCLLDRQIYLLDEPTSGVDQNHRKEILAVIRYLSERTNHIVVMTTHNPDDLDYVGRYKLTLLNN